MWLSLHTLSPPTSHFKIFGLDNFNQFLEASTSPSVQHVVVLTQQTSTLLQLLFPPHPLSKPFYFLTKLSSVFPFELRLSELIHILPHKSFPKIQDLRFLSSFTVRLKHAKLYFDKSFDICPLLVHSQGSFPALALPLPPSVLYGLIFSEDPEIISDTSEELAQHSLSHTILNTFQAKFLDKTECITLHIPITGKTVFDKVTESLSSLSNVHSFVFSSIFSAMYLNPEDAYFNYFSLYKIDPSPIINHCNIPCFQSRTYILFKASPATLEESLLLASDLDIVIPTSFICNTHKLVFEFSSEILIVRLLRTLDINLLELQISRLTPCTTSDIFFTNDFVSFLQARFFCRSTPKLCMVKSASSVVHEVLFFTSSLQLLSTIGEDALPLPFEHEGIQLCFSYLEPLLQKKPRPTTPYSYETHEEHFSRFQNTSDSLASRIPLFVPHKTHGQALAKDILLSVTTGVCGTESTRLSYFQSCSMPKFFLFIAPFPDNGRI